MRTAVTIILTAVIVALATFLITFNWVIKVQEIYGVPGDYTVVIAGQAYSYE